MILNYASWDKLLSFFSPTHNHDPDTCVTYWLSSLLEHTSLSSLSTSSFYWECSKGFFQRPTWLRIKTRTPVTHIAIKTLVLIIISTASVCAQAASACTQACCSESRTSSFLAHSNFPKLESSLTFFSSPRGFTSLVNIYSLILPEAKVCTMELFLKGRREVWLQL